MDLTHIREESLQSSSFSGQKYLESDWVLPEWEAVSKSKSKSKSDSDWEALAFNLAAVVVLLICAYNKKTWIQYNQTSFKRKLFSA